MCAFLFLPPSFKKFWRYPHLVYLIYLVDAQASNDAGFMVVDSKKSLST